MAEGNHTGKGDRLIVTVLLSIPRKKPLGQNTHVVHPIRLELDDRLWKEIVEKYG